MNLIKVKYDNRTISRFIEHQPNYDHRAVEPHKTNRKLSICHYSHVSIKYCIILCLNYNGFLIYFNNNFILV